MTSFLVFLFVSIISTKTVAAVQSCYACAGPRNVCLATNRTDFLKMDCQTFRVEGESLIRRTDQEDLLEKFDSEVGSRSEDVDVGCLTLTFTHGLHTPKERALKTCVPEQVFDGDICTYMNSLVEYIGGEKGDCRFCKDNDCNSAISARQSLVLVCVIYLWNCLW